MGKMGSLALATSRVLNRRGCQRQAMSTNPSDFSLRMNDETDEKNVLLHGHAIRTRTFVRMLHQNLCQQEDDHHDTSVVDADADAHKACVVVPGSVTLRSYGKLASGVFGCSRCRFSLLDACLETT